MSDDHPTSPVRTIRSGDGVVTLVLDRPDKLNALSIAVRDGVTDALQRLALDESVRVVVVTGAGRAFSAGFDLDELQRSLDDPELDREIWRSSDRFHETLIDFPLPLVAAVNGEALGGGMDTAVLCDVRVASSRARFGHPEARFGDVVYGPLHELIGRAAASELCLTGRIVDAVEAHRLGLVTALTSPEELDRVAQEIAATIATTPRDLLRRTKAKIIATSTIAFRSTRDL